MHDFELNPNGVVPPADHAIFAYKWRNSDVKLRQFVRLSNAAKIRMLDREKLRIEVEKEFKDWDWKSEDWKTKEGINRIAAKITILLQRASSSAEPMPKERKGKHPPELGRLLCFIK